MSEKKFIQAREYQRDCLLLAKKVYESGFTPNWLIALWRGGTEPGMVMQEYLSFKGIETDHIPIRTSRYHGIEKRAKQIRIHGLEYFIETVTSEDNLIIVDDVFDEGITINAVIDEIKRKAKKNAPTTRTATVYYKPRNNKTKITPDFYMYETDKWLVFPHELKGLTKEELKQKTDIADLL